MNEGAASGDWLALLPHGAAVHIPAALAVLFPLFFAVAWWAFRAARVGPGVWRALWALAVLQFICSGFAIFTGERAEFLSSGSSALIERHEDLAKVFTGHWLVIVLALGLRIWRPRFAGALTVVLVLLLLSQMGLAVYVGHLGGQLVK